MSSDKKLKDSYFVGEGNYQLLYETIGCCFDRTVDQFPDQQALVVPFQDVRWTYSELRERVDVLATGLLAVGIERGDRVAILGPNSVEWIITQIATAKIGAILVCINPSYRLYELEYTLNLVSCTALVTASKHKDGDYIAMLMELVPELRGVSAWFDSVHQAAKP